jgi:hypothetical protein
VARADARLKEAERLGFRAAVFPAGNLADGAKGREAKAATSSLDTAEIDVLAGLVARIAAGSGGAAPRRVGAEESGRGPRAVANAGVARVPRAAM